MKEYHISSSKRWMTVAMLFLAITIGSQAVLVEAAAVEEPPQPDLTCSTCGDCEIKDVGNCCGYYPQCVNRSFQNDTKAVSEWCKENEMAGVCGFPSIDTCACQEGQCVGQFSQDANVEVCQEEPSTTTTTTTTTTTGGSPNNETETETNQSETETETNQSAAADTFTTTCYNQIGTTMFVMAVGAIAWFQ